MFDLLRQGGGPMLFVAVFGFATFASAALFAVRGERRRLGFILCMGAATLLSIGGGMCADLAAVGHHGIERCGPSMQVTACLMVGFAESMAPGIVGFAVLSLAGMLTAAGMSRTSRADDSPRA
jgi:hypothetical protein